MVFGEQYWERVVPVFEARLCPAVLLLRSWPGPAHCCISSMLSMAPFGCFAELTDSVMKHVDCHMNFGYLCSDPLLMNTILTAINL